MHVFSSSMQLCGNRLAMIYFRPRVSFSANLCPMFIPFLEPAIQSAINRLLPTPADQHKVLFTNSGIQFTKRLHIF